MLTVDSPKKPTLMILWFDFIGKLLHPRTWRIWTLANETVYVGIAPTYSWRHLCSFKASKTKELFPYKFAMGMWRQKYTFTRIFLITVDFNTKILFHMFYLILLFSLDFVIFYAIFLAEKGLSFLFPHLLEFSKFVLSSFWVAFICSFG